MHCYHCNVIERGVDVTGLSRAGRPCRTASSLSSVVMEFETLSAVANRTNSAYTGQLSLATGLHFTGALIDVYLFCFQALTPDPWTVDMIGGLRTVNSLWRLSAVSGSAHYVVTQVRNRQTKKQGGEQPSLLSLR